MNLLDTAPDRVRRATCSTDAPMKKAPARRLGDSSAPVMAALRRREQRPVVLHGVEQKLHFVVSPFNNESASFKKLSTSCSHGCEDYYGMLGQIQQLSEVVFCAICSAISETPAPVLDFKPPTFLRLRNKIGAKWLILLE